MAPRHLEGKVALVTGASRGIGKGVALQLGEAGATVYITGRTLKAREGAKWCLEATAEEVESRGGICIPVQCDHTRDEEVKAVFDRIDREQDGQLDILVNNAYAAVNLCVDVMEEGFWQAPPEVWDQVNNVGLRNHYYCSVYGARLMAARRCGLIVNISSGGGIKYMLCVAYGVGKAALDRMAVDCAEDLRSHNVAAISLWPGPIKTEQLLDTCASDREEAQKWVISVVKDGGATPEYVGKCILHLANDKNIMNKSGRVFLSADLGHEYGFTDIDGGHPKNMRSLKNWLARTGWTTLSSFAPEWIQLPGWILTLSCNHF